jgi:hypothetical protein
MSSTRLNYSLFQTVLTTWEKRLTDKILTFVTFGQREKPVQWLHCITKFENIFRGKNKSKSS